MHAYVRAGRLVVALKGSGAVRQILSPQSDPATVNRQRFRAPWTIFWVAFAVRVLYITLAHTYRIRTVNHHFFFGYEMGRIARALVEGRGYADPFYGHTGPTTWVAPLFPLLLAGVFKVFGVYSLRSAWVILTIDSFFSALTVMPTWEIAARCFHQRVALWAAWIWALYPAAMQYAVRWVWEMSLSTLLFTAVLALALRMRGIGEPETAAPRQESGTLRRWLLFGLLWGLIGLSNPSLLLALPAAGIWVLWGARGTGSLQRQTTYAVGSAAIFLLCIAPWVVRNAMVFHRFIPMRANFGAEFCLGNGPGANGFLMEYEHPYESRRQMALYKKLGEVAYCNARGRLAWDTVRADPERFWRNSLKRVNFFWISVPHDSGQPWWTETARVLNYAFASVAGLLGLALALRRRVPGAWLLAWAFLLVPLIYYFVTAHARFRDPLEPLIAILAVFLFQSADKTRAWSIFAGGNG